MEWQCLSFENSVEHKEIKYDRRAKKEALLSYFVRGMINKYLNIEFIIKNKNIFYEIEYKIETWKNSVILAVKRRR